MHDLVARSHACRVQITAEVRIAGTVECGGRGAAALVGDAEGRRAVRYSSPLSTCSRMHSGWVP